MTSRGNPVLSVMGLAFITAVVLMPGFGLLPLCSCFLALAMLGATANLLGKAAGTRRDGRRACGKRRRVGRR